MENSLLGALLNPCLNAQINTSHRCQYIFKVAEHRQTTAPNFRPFGVFSIVVNIGPIEVRSDHHLIPS